MAPRPVTAPPALAPNHNEITTPLQPGQLAMFEPTAPERTYLEAVIDHGPLRTCTGCKRPLGPTMFFVNRATSDGIDYQCRDCKLMYQRLNRGVSTVDARLRPPPDQRCEVCGGPGTKKGICLDHDHDTGAFRGWLCTWCNTALGGARDDPDVLRALATYLETRRQQGAA